MNLGRNWTQFKGLISESITAAFLEAHGWTLVGRHRRLLGVEIDLVMRSPAGVLTLIEVKSRSLWEGFQPHPRQQRRLRRVIDHLSQKEPVEFNFSSLCRDGRVRIIPWT